MKVLFHEITGKCHNIWGKKKEWCSWNADFL